MIFCPIAGRTVQNGYINGWSDMFVACPIDRTCHSNLSCHFVHRTYSYMTSLPNTCFGIDSKNLLYCYTSSNNETIITEEEDTSIYHYYQPASRERWRNNSTFLVSCFCCYRLILFSCHWQISLSFPFNFTAGLSIISSRNMFVYRSTRFPWGLLVGLQFRLSALLLASFPRRLLAGFRFRL